jgi:hypothetical protein
MRGPLPVDDRTLLGRAVASGRDWRAAAREIRQLGASLSEQRQIEAAG